MTDAREALVALAEALTRAADRCCQCADGHHDQMPPYGTDDDVRISRDDARKIADAILAEFDVTPPGERVKPSVEVGVCEHQNANYLRMMSERDALRAEVERLRAVSAAQPYETERELAVALDEARQQVADLRAFASWLVSLDDDNPDSTGRQERRTVTLSQIIDRARVTLDGLGERSGETTTGEGVGTGAGEGAPRQDTGSAWVTRSVDCPEAPAQAHPAPVVPDSAGLRERVKRAVSEAIERAYTFEGDLDPTVDDEVADAVLAVMGQDVTARRPGCCQGWEWTPSGVVDALSGVERFDQEPCKHNHSTAVRPRGQEGS